MRIYLLSEGVAHAPTETVKAVSTTLANAVEHAYVFLCVGIRQWHGPEEMDATIMGFQRMWVNHSDVMGDFYITEWETVE